MKKTTCINANVGTGCFLEIQTIIGAYSFHRFFHRIPAAEDDLNVLIGIHLDAFYHLTNDAVIEFMQQIVAQIPREHEGAIGIAHILAQKAFLIMELFFAIAESSVSLLCDMI